MSERPPEPTSQTLVEHLTSGAWLKALTLFATGLAFARAAVFVRGDAEAFFVVLRSSSLTGIAAALVVVMSSIVAAGVIATAWISTFPSRPGRLLRWCEIGAQVVGALYFVVFSPRLLLVSWGWSVVIGSLIGLATGAFITDRARASGFEPLDWVQKSRLGFAVAAPILFYAVASVFYPWLPREDLTLDNGTVVSGYVIEDSGPWMTVVDADSRELRVFEVARIDNREIYERDDAE